MKVLHEYGRVQAPMKETYGNSFKMIDCILEDIRDTKPVIESDNKRVINMVNTVRKVLVGNEKFDQLQEDENCTVIDYVKRLL